MAMTRLFIAFTLFLPLILGGSAQAQPPSPIGLVPPSPIRCFWTDATSKRDRTGAIFVNCQARDERGQVVWRQDDQGSRLVLESGYSGRGSLDVDVDGLWLTTANPNADTGIRILVPEFVP